MSPQMILMTCWPNVNEIAADEWWRFTAEVGNKVLLVPEKHTLLPSDKKCWNAKQAETPETFLTLSRLRSSDLTFARVASLDVSGDADNGQGVDACQAEKQGEETVYLEEKHRKWIEYRGRWPSGR